MSVFKLIKGSDKDISAFEKLVSDAIENGYELANDLVAQPSGSEVLLFQAMINDDELEDYEDEDEEEEEDEN